MGKLEAPLRNLKEEEEQHDREEEKHEDKV